MIKPLPLTFLLIVMALSSPAMAYQNEFAGGTDDSRFTTGLTVIGDSTSVEMITEHGSSRLNVAADACLNGKKRKVSVISMDNEHVVLSRCR